MSCQTCIDRPTFYWIHQTKMTSPISSVYTASTVFLRSLSEAGITHAFVNWGSDHPALLEELGRQRSSSQNISQRPKHNEDGLLDSTIADITTVTSPHEMVALSAAQGFAQVTGKPAAVIIHVDVGTQVCMLEIDCTAT